MSSRMQKYQAEIAILFFMLVNDDWRRVSLTRWGTSCGHFQSYLSEIINKHSAMLYAHSAKFSDNIKAAIYFLCSCVECPGTHDKALGPCGTWNALFARFVTVEIARDVIVDFGHMLYKLCIPYSESKMSNKLLLLVCLMSNKLLLLVCLSIENQ